MKVKSVLVSQPKPESDKSPYFDLATNCKVKIDFRPFIHVEGVSTKDFRSQRINFTDFNAVIFTSRNAVDYFFKTAEEIRYNVPESLKYFCISEAIAFYLQKYIVYRKRKVFTGKQTFQDLIPLLKKNKDSKFLLPCSDIISPNIKELLEKDNINYQCVVLYRTVCSDLSDLSDVNYDVLAFFSPSGIKSLFQNFPNFKQNDTRIAVFGSTTSKAAEEAGLRIDICAPQPEAPSMTKALELYIKDANKNGKK
ncbi:MAG: uroporphyrinogen-III synthase [Vicingaceae bacterium]|nr:MAG: uroporphyrinogen-III synthase [Flavobacteriales bacterium BRH_c54]MBL1233158.1 uroporphyrinogen-III synthase [Flavobacteriales bacterium]MBQ19440.1 uroporphyrinogen-III synthase [Flavobacteriales bacterium]MDF1674575.1 uroporphyrinogen-III synthase [Vicingaceae bacterium]